jgi:hypothetical protein
MLIATLCSHFIQGLFGKGNMYLFGCGNAWKIEFNSKDNFPSKLQLNHNKGSTLVAVAGRGESVKKE